MAALIAISIIQDNLKQRRFNEGYVKYLRKNEGVVIFCYTNRVKFCNIIESQIIPTLNKGIHTVKLEGKDPQTDLNKIYISYALRIIKQVGFPNLMVVVDGRVEDISLHKEIYDAINNGKLEKLQEILIEKLKSVGDFN